MAIRLRLLHKKISHRGVDHSRKTTERPQWKAKILPVTDVLSVGIHWEGRDTDRHTLNPITTVHVPWNQVRQPWKVVLSHLPVTSVEQLKRTMLYHDRDTVLIHKDSMPRLAIGPALVLVKEEDRFLTAWGWLVNVVPPERMISSADPPMIHIHNVDPMEETPMLP